MAVLPTEHRLALLSRLDRTTSRWGRITMLIGVLISIAGPLYLVLFGGLNITQARQCGVMYQAFMIGNICNKLLPAALIAQTNVSAKTGPKRGELTAGMAICGAAMVPMMSLLIFVGFLGAVLVQAIVSMKQPRPTVIGLVVAAVMIFVVVPLVPVLGCGLHRHCRARHGAAVLVPAGAQGPGPGGRLPHLE